MNLLPMLAQNLNDTDPTGLLMAEKFDGIRCVWDGTNLISRHGNIFNCPDSFKAGLPKNEYLDGELFMGYGTLEQLGGLINAKNAAWDQVTFKVFDIIMPGALTRREQHLKTLGLPKHCEKVVSFVCRSLEDFKHFENEIYQRGGEGAVAKDPKSHYINGRTGAFLKYKRRSHKEAKVLAYKDNTFEYTGMIDALICEYAGETYTLTSGLSDKLRTNPPAIGDTITFSHFGLTKSGKPREMAFVAIRNYE